MRKEEFLNHFNNEGLTYLSEYLEKNPIIAKQVFPRKGMRYGITNIHNLLWAKFGYPPRSPGYLSAFLYSFCKNADSFAQNTIEKQTSGWKKLFYVYKKIRKEYDELSEEAVDLYASEFLSESDDREEETDESDEHANNCEQGPELPIRSMLTEAKSENVILRYELGCARDELSRSNQKIQQLQTQINSNSSQTGCKRTFDEFITETLKNAIDSNANINFNSNARELSIKFISD